MTMIGSISAKITADDTEFLAAMGRVKTSLSSQATQLRSSANNYAKWGAAAAAAAAVAGAAIVKSTASSIQELRNLSQISGTSTQDLQKLSYAASTVGVSQDKLANILKDVNDRIGDFTKDNAGEMKDFFDKIAPQVGVTAQSFKDLSGADSLQLYVSTLEKANLSQQEMTTYMEKIASDSTALIPILSNGGAAYAAMAKEAEDLGLVLSDIDVAKAAAAAEQMGKLEFIMGSAAQQATVELAPVIIGLAKHLTEAAQEAGGFGKVFFNAIDSSVSVIGVFADGIRGINVIIEGLNVAFWGLAHVVNLAMKSAFEGIDSFINGVKESINGVIQGANLLGAEMDLLQTGSSSITQYLQGEANASKKSFDEAANSLHNLAMQEMPSDAMKRWVEEARASANEVAESVSAAMVGQKTGDDAGGSTGGMNEEEKKKLQEKVEAIRQSNLMEVEALKEKFTLESEVLAAAYEQKLINEEAFQQQMVGISKKYADEKNAIEQKAKDKQKAVDDIANKQKLSSAKTIFGGLSSLMNTESRKLFEIGKTAALANALINAYESITSAYAAGSKIGGPPVGVAFAAAAGAAQFATIQQIQSQSFSKGGAGSSQSYSNGLPVTNTQEAGGGQPSSRQVNISLTGSSFGAGSIRDLIGEINEAIGDGVSLSTG